MADFGVRVTGGDEVRAALNRLQDAARILPGVQIRVGSSVAYSVGIETGRTASGRVARAAGGLYFLKRAVEKVLSQFDDAAFGEALQQGPEATLKFLKQVGFDIEREAKARLTPFPYSPRTRYHTGTLRRSIQTIYPGRPVSIPTVVSTRGTVRP